MGVVNLSTKVDDISRRKCLSIILVDKTAALNTVRGFW